MSQGRRTIDRRRRVLYSAAADTGPSTAASRREAARLREARSPAATYGSGVHQRLRGRWFGLVPVRRRTMSIAVGCIAAIAVLLCAAHYMAVAWPSIASRGDIARPLRLDRPDSFGRWFMGVLMVGSAGASFLIYQLRCHRLDDFRGHYRIWRLVLIVMLLASLNSVVSLVDWSGALLDVTIGRRVALKGSDWVRIVVSLGGAILMLRLIAEVYRSRVALAAILAASLFLAIPEAVKWNVMQVETIERWTLVTSAPLLAFTCLFLSFGVYLRMLYREVRRLNENDQLKDRWQQMRLRVFQRHHAEQPQADDEPKRRWWRRSKQEVSEELAEEEEWEEERQPEPIAEDTPEEDEDAAEPKPKRRWFGLRAAKAESDDEEQPEAASDDPPPKPKKKRRFSLRLDPAKSAENETKPNDDSDESEESKPKRKFGLGAFRRQRSESNAAEEEPTRDSSPTTKRPQPADNSDYINPDEIDWNGLSKAERRRLRKQLKRQNRAA